MLNIKTSSAGLYNEDGTLHNIVSRIIVRRSVKCETIYETFDLEAYIRLTIKIGSVYL